MPKNNVLNLALLKRNESILGMSVDHVTRTIFLFGDIDDDSAYRFVVAMHLLDTTPDAPITVVLNTPGGAIESGYAIFDSIRLARNCVNIVAYGSVMSMGSIIMQAGDLRLMTPNARMMIHTGNVGMEGGFDSDKLISVGEEIKGIREHFIEVLTERSELREAEVRKLLLRETYFSAREALELGLIDGIREPPPGAKDTSRLDVAPRKRKARK